MADKASFFVLSCEPGKEARCCTEFLRRSAIEGLRPDFVKRAFIATHKEIRSRPADGKPITVDAKSFPGYLICEMIWDYRIYDLLKKTPFSWGLLPHRPEQPNIRNYAKLSPTDEDRLHAYESWAPKALETEEAALLTLTVKQQKEKAIPVCEFSIGDKLVVNSKFNPYNKCEGRVKNLILVGKEIRLNLTVMILGRAVEVEIPFLECRKQG